VTLILDSSVVIAWLMPDEQAAEADLAVTEAMLDGADVPALFGFEVANAMMMNVRRKRIGLDAALASLADLGTLDIRPEIAPTPEQLQRIATLAANHRLSAYDAAYLELARRLVGRLATLDGDLKTAAKAENVPLFVP
jgi:predicted nucleic acid-binding protein